MLPVQSYFNPTSRNIPMMGIQTTSLCKGWVLLVHHYSEQVRISVLSDRKVYHISHLFGPWTSTFIPFSHEGTTTRAQSHNSLMTQVPSGQNDFSRFQPHYFRVVFFVLLCFRFFEILLTYVSLMCMTWGFDICIYCEMITTIRLVNISMVVQIVKNLPAMQET